MKDNAITEELELNSSPTSPIRSALLYIKPIIDTGHKILENPCHKFLSVEEFPSDPNRRSSASKGRWATNTEE